jgi:hypothetical protein
MIAEIVIDWDNVSTAAIAVCAGLLTTWAAHCFAIRRERRMQQEMTRRQERERVTALFSHAISVARRMRQTPGLQINHAFESERATVSAQLELQECVEIRDAWVTACTTGEGVAEPDKDMVKLMKAYIASI